MRVVFFSLGKVVDRAVGPGRRRSLSVSPTTPHRATLAPLPTTMIEEVWRDDMGGRYFWVRLGPGMIMGPIDRGGYEWLAAACRSPSGEGLPHGLARATVRILSMLRRVRAADACDNRGGVTSAWPPPANKPPSHTSSTVSSEIGAAPREGHSIPGIRSMGQAVEEVYCMTPHHSLLLFFFFFATLPRFSVTDAIVDAVSF